MWKLLVLSGAFLCFSLTATANDSNGALDTVGPASEPAAPIPLYPSDRAPWQIGVGFKYQHFEPYGLDFHNFGYDAEVTRYFNNWLGIEGAVETGFGHTGTTPKIPRSLVANSFFLGAGPHIAVSNRSRLEPWAHVLLGMEHFRFTQTNNQLGLGSNTAFGLMAGGGVDIRIKGSISWRAQVDYIGTHFQSAMQNNYSVGTGIAFSF